MRQIVRRALTPRPPKPQRLIEDEVAPGRLLLTLRAKRSLTIIAAVLGAGVAVAPVSTTAQYGGPSVTAVLPPGRRLDPT